MKVRLIEQKDMDNVIDMLQSISQFYPEKDRFESLWVDFENNKSNHGFVFLVEEQIVAYGAIIIETKIRGGKLGHIEDIVVNKNFRGSGFGKNVIEYLLDFAERKKCYKVTLSCKEHNVNFYEKCGLDVSGITMNKLL